MTIDDLTVNFADLSRETLLEDWQWLLGTTRLPVLLTVAGDAFVQDTDTGEVFFLDTVEGSLDEVAESGSEFRELLNDRQFVMDRFSVKLVAPLLKANQRPPAGKVFSFKQPPVLGGAFEASNLETTDIAVHFSILGQIWDKVRQLPDGTPIESIKISD